MAYDVDRRPGEWVGRRARRETRIAVLGTIAALGLAAVAVAVSLTGALVTVLLLGAAVYVWRATERQIDASEPWVKGRNAEEAVGFELEKLRREGFIVMHDIQLDGLGNVDHLVSGPSGVFLVETKFRSFRPSSRGLVTQQAAHLRGELGVWVTAVICKATVGYEPRECRRVWIMGKVQLLDWIRAQRNAPLEFERLARWADRL